MDASKLQSYPNPSKDEIFNIAFKNSSTVELNVFDMLGKNVFRANNVDATNNYILNLAALPKGVYVLKLQGSDLNKVIRIQK